MKTTNPITPEAAGLSLAVLSGPRGAVLDNWPCIEYTVQVINDRRQVVWTGEYRLGVGHVKPVSYDTLERSTKYFWKLTDEERNLSHHWARGANFKKTPEVMQKQADVAAKLAKIQKVLPTLNDVVHSLLSDGSPFFDGLNFEDWANEFGYSSDSIKAKETFDVCDRIGRDLSRSLSRDTLEGLREWASNY